MDVYSFSNGGKVPIKLLEPNIGRVVRLQIEEEKEYCAKLYIDQLTTYAQIIGAQCTVEGKIVQLILPEGNIAEYVRKKFRK